MFWNKTKKIKELYNENIKSLQRESENDVRKWKNYLMLMDLHN